MTSDESHMSQDVISVRERAASCPICFASVVRVVDDRVSKDGRRVRNVQCQTCGCLFIYPRASEEEYAAYYRSGFSKEFDRVVSADTQMLATHAQPKAERILSFIEPYVRPGMRILEIGCGFGNVLALLRDRHQATVVGVEPDPQGAIVARVIFGLNVQTTTLQEYLASWNGEQFDAILMHHVLEHFLDPHVACRALQRLLRHDGFLYIGVPNGSCPSYPKSMFFRFPHTLTFTPYALAYLFWYYGWKLVSIDRLTRPLACVMRNRETVEAAVPWTNLCRTSLPPPSVYARIHCMNVYHIIRLSLRRWIGAAPVSWKQMIKRLLHI